MAARENHADDFMRTHNLVNEINGAHLPQDPQFTETVREGLLSKVDHPYPPEGHDYPRQTT